MDSKLIPASFELFGTTYNVVFNKTVKYNSNNNECKSN